MSVILGIKIEKSAGALGAEGRKIIRQITKETMLASAGHWHEELLREHFIPSNRGRFHHEPRTEVYKDHIKKQSGRGPGKYVDLLLSGKSRRYMLAFGTITGSTRQATVRMKPTGYFTNPFIGTFVDPETKKPRKRSMSPSNRTSQRN